ncbi:MAG TPA: hypothetical protein VIG74_02360 [Alphaproteobacteria bacterium]|jgi:hypothetical protein
MTISIVPRSVRLEAADTREALYLKNILEGEADPPQTLLERPMVVKWVTWERYEQDGRMVRLPSAITFRDV